MLNEDRVKHMIKLADYETKGGKEEQKITSFYKKDYISMNIMWTLLWMTVAYGLVVGTVWLALRDLVTVELTQIQVLSLWILIASIYIVLFVTYMVAAKRYYKRRHARAYHRVKKFKENLMILEKMYEKEDQDAETV